MVMLVELPDPETAATGQRGSAHLLRTLAPSCTPYTNSMSASLVQLRGTVLLVV